MPSCNRASERVLRLLFLHFQCFSVPSALLCDVLAALRHVFRGVCASVHAHASLTMHCVLRVGVLCACSNEAPRGVGKVGYAVWICTTMQMNDCLFTRRSVNLLASASILQSLRTVRPLMISKASNLWDSFLAYMYDRREVSTKLGIA